MTQVILGKSRVREICMPGSVRAKAEWLSYSTNSIVTVEYALYLNEVRLDGAAPIPRHPAAQPEA